MDLHNWDSQVVLTEPIIGSASGLKIYKQKGLFLHAVGRPVLSVRHIHQYSYGVVWKGPGCWDPSKLPSVFPNEKLNFCLQVHYGH